METTYTHAHTLLVNVYTISPHMENTSCSPQIPIMVYIIFFLPIHHKLMVKSMKLTTYQCFSERVFVFFLCVNLEEFYHIIGYMFY